MKHLLFFNVLQFPHLAYGVIVAQTFDQPLSGSFNPVDGVFYNIDIDQNGLSDFWVTSNGGPVELLPLGNNRVFSSIGQTGTRSVRNLSEGTLIGPVSQDSNPRFTGIEDSRNSFDQGQSFIYLCLAQLGGPVSCTSTLPADPEQRTHYGLEFEIEGETHYGWVQVSAPERLLGNFEIHGWGYETIPGEPIEAGALPEPSTIGLTALSLVGLALRRKRSGQIFFN